MISDEELDQMYAELARLGRVYRNNWRVWVVNNFPAEVSPSVIAANHAYDALEAEINAALNDE